MKTILLGLFLACVAATPMAKHKHDAVDGVMSFDLFAEDSRVHLLIGAQKPGQPPGLRYIRSEDGGEMWSAEVPLGEGQPATIAHRGMDAQIAAAGDHLVAVWPTAGSDKMGRGPMATAISSDGGKSWRAGSNPADDGLDIGHSFIDIAADDAGVFHLVWLDSRQDDDKGLRYARSIDGGATWQPNVTLDPNTCECCWNTVAVAPGGRISVLYRNLGPRDMAMISSDDSGKTWGHPVVVGGFDWKINACPHVGGGLALTESAIYAVVWTAKSTNTHGVYVLSSRDGQGAWTPPYRLGTPDASHPTLAADGAGNVTVVWDATTDAGQAAFASGSNDAGKTWSKPRRLNDAGSSATHPRVIYSADGARVFWTEQKAGEPARWTSVRLNP